MDNEGNAEMEVRYGVPIYHARQNGDLLVVPALGHLYTIAAMEKGKRACPVFDYQWVPRHLAERNASRIRVWLSTITSLAENAEGYVDACDFDIEGSLIGYCLLKYACHGKHQIAKRMKYSTLTRDELRESYAHLQPHIDFDLVQAGLTRHEIDWLYGINLSRALTSALKVGGKQYTMLSTGRVQGPALKFLEEREKAINCFVPTPYWTVTAKIQVGEAEYQAAYERTIETKMEASQLLDSCKTSEGIIKEVKMEKFSQSAPYPFDLGGLQSEAYRIFKITPIRTASIAQRLYLDALISYPRTSSQKLPPAISYKTILEKLSKTPVYRKQAAELLSKQVLQPHEGEKVDSAHPAIYPTGNQPEKTLGTAERSILDLVVRRFLAVFGDPALHQSIRVTVSIGGNLFLLEGSHLLNEGWINLYRPYSQVKEECLPSVADGQKVHVKRVASKTNFTKPPPRYNPRSLLLEMEKENIGTKATRASTIQTLYDRKYVHGEDKLGVSELGFEVSEVLTKYCPTVVSPKLTRKLEEEMDEVQQGKQSKEEVLQNAVSILEPVIAQIRANESAIGQILSQALQRIRLEERTVGACPQCSDGKLVILHSKKTGKRFVGCTNYFKGKCDVTFPLPQRGSIKPLSSPCRSCGCPVISVCMKYKRSWKLCLNPSCPSKGEHKNP